MVVSFSATSLLPVDVRHQVSTCPRKPSQSQLPSFEAWCTPLLSYLQNIRSAVLSDLLGVITYHCYPCFLTATTPVPLRLPSEKLCSRLLLQQLPR